VQLESNSSGAGLDSARRSVRRGANRFEASDPTTIVRLVEAAVGLAFVPKSCARPRRRAHRRARVPGSTSDAGSTPCTARSRPPWSNRSRRARALTQVPVCRRESIPHRGSGARARVTISRTRSGHFANGLLLAWGNAMVRSSAVVQALFSRLRRCMRGSIGVDDLEATGSTTTDGATSDVGTSDVGTSDIGKSDAGVLPLGIYADCARGVHGRDGKRVLERNPGSNRMVVSPCPRTVRRSRPLMSTRAVTSARSSSTPSDPPSRRLGSRGQVATGFIGLCVLGPGRESFERANMNLEHGAPPVPGRDLFLSMQGVLREIERASVACGRRRTALDACARSELGSVSTATVDEARPRRCPSAVGEYRAPRKSRRTMCTRGRTNTSLGRKRDADTLADGLRGDRAIRR